MKLETEKQEFLTRYLLGQLSESESAQLEDSSFANPELLDELRAVENDLIDDYVHGELAPNQTASFERRFLANPERRQRIEFAVALDSVSSNNRVTNPIDQRGGTRTWRDSLATIFAGPRSALIYVSAAIIVTILIAAWLWLMKSDPSRQVAQRDTTAAAQPPANTASPGPSPQVSGQVQPSEPTIGSAPTQSDTARDPVNDSGSLRQPASIVATFVLSPGLSRSESERTRLIIPQGRKLVRLKLELEKRDATRYRSFVAELQRANGEQVWKSGPVEIRGSRALILNVPVSVFPANAADYELTLTGREANSSNFEPVGYYYLHIIKE